MKPAFIPCTFVAEFEYSLGPEEGVDRARVVLVRDDPDEPEPYFVIEFRKEGETEFNYRLDSEMKNMQDVQVQCLSNALFEYVERFERLRGLN